jgi:hypothetical protein
MEHQSDGSWTSTSSWVDPVLDIPNGIGSNATFGTVTAAHGLGRCGQDDRHDELQQLAERSGPAGTTITFDNVATNNGINVTAGNNTIAALIQSLRDTNVDVRLAVC